MTIEQIAQEMGWKHRTTGVRIRRIGACYWDDDIIQILHDEYDFPKGYKTIRMIAEERHVSMKTIKDWIHKLGLKPDKYLNDVVYLFNEDSVNKIVAQQKYHKHKRVA